MKKIKTLVFATVTIAALFCASACSNPMVEVQDDENYEISEENFGPERAAYSSPDIGGSGSNFRGGRQGGGNSARGSRVGRRGRGW